MPKTDLLTSAIDLMASVGNAHHHASQRTHGDDREWPIWYAEYLQQPLSQLLNVAFTQSQLIHCLINTERERTAMQTNTTWTEFYAQHFVECFAAADAPGEDTLILYHTEHCPFCRLVRQAIDRLGIEVELRDVGENRRDYDALVAARKRGTVPVLRIIGADGEERWMPESHDIVRYLEQTYA